MNRLDALGFKQHLFLDHSGAYDNYLNTMRTQAGLTATFEQRKFPLKYMSFNNEEIADTLAVLRHWNRVMARDKDRRTTATACRSTAAGKPLSRVRRPSSTRSTPSSTSLSAGSAR